MLPPLVSAVQASRLAPASPVPFTKKRQSEPRPQLLKPRTPLDCPACRHSGEHFSEVEPPPSPVRPWRELKSRRGAPKRVNTEGFACPNHQCPYFGITEAQIHALVGDGTHGQVERIQTFRCQACHRTFTARRHTPLYRLKTPSHQIALMLSALAEGLDASAAERVFGFRQATITHWVTRAGEHAESLHERCFHHLQIPHLQLDELRTRLRCSTQVLWLWLALDPLTKILPVLQLGPRTHPMAHQLIHSLVTSSWLQAAFHSLVVTGYISTSMRSRPILDTGSRGVVEVGRCASGRWRQT